MIPLTSAAREPRSAVHPVARSDSRADSWRGFAPWRTHSRQPRTRRAAGRSPHHRCQCLRRARIRRAHQRPRRARHLHSRRKRGEKNFRASASDVRERRTPLGIAVRRRARRGNPEPPGASGPARLYFIRDGQARRRIFPRRGIEEVLERRLAARGHGNSPIRTVGRLTRRSSRRSLPCSARRDTKRATKIC